MVVRELAAEAVQGHMQLVSSSLLSDPDCSIPEMDILACVGAQGMGRRLVGDALWQAASEPFLGVLVHDLGGFNGFHVQIVFALAEAQDLVRNVEGQVRGQGTHVDIGQDADDQLGMWEDSQVRDVTKNTATLLVKMVGGKEEKETVEEATLIPYNIPTVFSRQMGSNKRERERTCLTVFIESVAFVRTQGPAHAILNRRTLTGIINGSLKNGMGSQSRSDAFLAQDLFAIVLALGHDHLSPPNKVQHVGVHVPGGRTQCSTVVHGDLDKAACCCIRKGLGHEGRRKVGALAQLLVGKARVGHAQGLEDLVVYKLLNGHTGRIGGGLTGDAVHGVVVVEGGAELGVDRDVLDALNQIPAGVGPPKPGDIERREVLVGRDLRGKAKQKKKK